jgi:hypothetical protein
MAGGRPRKRAKNTTGLQNQSESVVSQEQNVVAYISSDNEDKDPHKMLG